MGEISIPGDPGGLSGLASQLDGVAGEIGAVQGRVSANGLGGSWSGAAAEAFRSSLDELPGELAKVAHAFGDAGHAISGFSARLADLQQKARWYSQQLAAARDDLAAAESRRGSAQTELRAAQQRQRAAHDPASLNIAQSAVAMGQARLDQAVVEVEDASRAVARLETAENALREEYDQAVSACCAALDGARHGGSHSLLSWVGNHVKGMEQFVEGGVATLWHGAANLAGEVEDELEHGIDAGLRELDEHWGDWRQTLLVFDDAIGTATFALGAGLAAAAGAAALVVGPGDVVAAGLLAADGAVLKAGTALQTADEGLIAAGDGVEAVRGKTQYRDELDNDASRLAITLFGGKAAGATVGKVAGDAVKSIGSASSKLVSLAKRELGPKTAKELGKNVEDLVDGKIADGVVDTIGDVPRSLITPPLEVPTPFTIPLPSLGAARH